jgi:hypothetical protein
MHPTPRSDRRFLGESGHRGVMRTFYFDTKNGIPIRDRRGLEFPTTGDAIEHSKELARRLRHDTRIKDRPLTIVVVDEFGVEIHREPVYPDTSDTGSP